MRLVAQPGFRDHADELGSCVRARPGQAQARRAALSTWCRVTPVSITTPGITENIHGEILDQGPVEARVAYEPYGVVAAILPFNWPPIHFSKKCAPALAVGQHRRHQTRRAGTLDGIAAGRDRERGPTPRRHQRGQRTSCPGRRSHRTRASSGSRFTGATATGRKVMQSAAEEPHLRDPRAWRQERTHRSRRRRLSTRSIAYISIEGMFYNQGEACTSTSRILVHESSLRGVRRTLFVDATSAPR